jgi:hypothetical protein
MVSIRFETAWVFSFRASRVFLATAAPPLTLLSTERFFHVIEDQDSLVGVRSGPGLKRSLAQDLRVREKRLMETTTIEVALSAEPLLPGADEAFHDPAQSLPP